MIHAKDINEQSKWQELTPAVKFTSRQQRL